MRKLWKIAFLLNILCLWNNSVLCEINNKNCGGTFSGYQYTIKSPNYPSPYPENQDCVYFLHGTRQARCEQKFHLQFLDFDIRASEKCDNDFLQIADRNIFYGKMMGLRIFKGSNDILKIHFHSGREIGGRGFRILVTTLPCVNSQGGQNIT